jgi:hypothetical protein
MTSSIACAHRQAMKQGSAKGWTANPAWLVAALLSAGVPVTTPFWCCAQRTPARPRQSRSTAPEMPGELQPLVGLRRGSVAQKRRSLAVHSPNQ